MVVLMAAVASVVLAGCGTNPVAKVDNHIRRAVQTPQTFASTVPAPVRQVPIPPPPRPVVDEKRYSVSVIDVPAREILLAMSRDTGINIDIYPGIEGRVTLNAIDQTIRQILTRMAKQIDMRWEVDGPNIAVMQDAPFLKLYRVDYVNINRDTDSTFGVQTQVVGPPGVTSASAGGASQNTSQLKITNSSKNRFWENLEKNIKDLLRETDKQLPEGSSETVVRAQTQGSSTATTRTQSAAARANPRGQATTTMPGDVQAQNEQLTQTLTFREAASVIVNVETGTISVRATSRQQEKVAQFIEQVSGASKRQVLIEATVVEVELNDAYQSGVDWSAVGRDGLGYTFRQSFTPGGSAVTTPNAPSSSTSPIPSFTLGYLNPAAAVGGSIASAVKLLSSFGSTKVLSSPRQIALNNQTAVMKVVENRIYFTVTSNPTTSTSATGATTTLFSYTSTPNVVPEGFVMSVTPQIGENDIVTLNIRPSITRITGYKKDPNPDLARANVVNEIPEIQTREFETVLRVASGQTSVLGGLMQDRFQASRNGLPILSRIPIFGDAVSARNDVGLKTELVVFIRPIVLKDASLETDLSEYKRYLPDSRFFKEAEPVVNIPILGIPDPVQPRP
ncbi:MAG: type II and III secretion system protein [Aeromicrobium sp.]|nr:type II and III secretion system protein [Burkholderiales bacterium]